MASALDGLRCFATGRVRKVRVTEPRVWCSRHSSSSPESSGITSSTNYSFEPKVSGPPLKLPSIGDSVPTFILGLDISTISTGKALLSL